MKLIVMVASGVVWALGQAVAGPVDFSAPSNHLGAADTKGNLQIWRDVEGVGLTLGRDSSYLPLRFKYSSDGTPGAGMLGSGFYCPMFEARNVLIRPREMRVDLPCGKEMYFWGSASDSTKYHTPDEAWTGSQAGADFIFWRDDGWKLTYHDSRLSSLVTDDRHVFTWNYSASGMPEDVKEDGLTVIAVEPNAAGQTESFVFQGRHCQVEYADRPLMQVVMDQKVVGSLVKALSKFQYPEEKFETFEFGLTSGQDPTLTLTDEEKKQTVYTWDASSNHLISEKGANGDWTYTVGGIAQAYGLPPISRSNAAGKTEAMSADTATGTYTATNLDGTTIVTRVFKAPGPLYNKVQKVEKITNGVTAQVYRASYDELGRLRRSIDDTGRITMFSYDSHGVQVGQKVLPPSDPVILAALGAKEKVLLERLGQASAGKNRDYALNDLIIFYTNVALNFKKAAALLTHITNRGELYDLKLSLAINADLPPKERNQTLVQLMQEFPDKKTYTANLLTKEDPDGN